MKLKFALLMSSMLALSACSNDTKSALGIKKPAPDEFTVISNAPLSIPPEFDLKAPGADAYDASVMNKNSAATPTKISSGALSSEDRNFLNSLDNKKSYQDENSIKKTVDREYKNKKADYEDKNAVSKKLTDLRGSNKDPVIDPISERDRIKENVEEGKSVNEGDVKNRTPSTLKRIF